MKTEKANLETLAILKVIEKEITEDDAMRGSQRVVRTQDEATAEEIAAVFDIVDIDGSLSKYTHHND
jgi:hypothetical protein